MSESELKLKDVLRFISSIPLFGSLLSLLKSISHLSDQRDCQEIRYIPHYKINFPPPKVDCVLRGNLQDKKAELQSLMEFNMQNINSVSLRHILRG